MAGKHADVTTAPVIATTRSQPRSANEVLAVATARPNDAVALSSIATTRPRDRRDRFATLLDIYDLSCAPLPEVGDAARLLGSPELLTLKRSLEADWLTELEAVPLPSDIDADDPVE